MPSPPLRGLGVLQVEPTDHCNLRCAMCAPHHEGWETVHGVPKGFLDADLWERILDGLVAEDCELDHVIFQWLGDPSLHPELPRLVGAAAQRLQGRVNYLRIDTNAIRLDANRIDALLERLAEAGPAAPPLLIVVTLDAHTTEAYARVKGADRLAQVRRHVRHLVRQRSQSAVSVNLQLQFVVQDGNAHEARSFLDYWTGLLACQGDPDRWHDEIMFKRLSVGGGAAGQAAADALYDKTIRTAGLRAGRWPDAEGPVTVCIWEKRPWQQDDQHQGERTACPGLWLTPVIRHDGALLACCADLGSEMKLGNLSDTSFLRLWNGPVATAHRLAHLSGRFEGVCAGCGGINWYDLPPDAAARTRQQAAALHLEAP